jgi:hypothetical protein
VPDVGELLALASSRRQALANDPTNARLIVSALLNGRATYRPSTERQAWELRGQGSIAGLFYAGLSKR